MFSSKKFQFQGSVVSDAAYFEILAALYSTLVPIVFAGLAQAIAGAVIAWRTGDAATAAFAVAGVILAVVRTFGVFAYRRRVVEAPPMDRAEAVAWERRYTSGSVTAAVILGLLAARSLMLDDAIFSMMAVGIIFDTAPAWSRGCRCGPPSRLSPCWRPACLSSSSP